MTIESLQLKIENQQKIVKELTDENEQLYQQFNHLIVRNNKFLKRIDDLQQIVTDLHIRIEELQLINDNLLKINDGIRKKTDGVAPLNDNLRETIDNLHRRIDELNLRSDILHRRTSMGLESSIGNIGLGRGNKEVSAESLSPAVDLDKIVHRWKVYPGQEGRNTPNLRKQVQMLVHLYEHKSLTSTDLFYKTGINGVTGARYVGILKKFHLIDYKGARKKGQYFITQTGIDLIEKNQDEFIETPLEILSLPSPDVDSLRISVVLNDPDL